MEYFQCWRGEKFRVQVNVVGLLQRPDLVVMVHDFLGWVNVCLGVCDVDGVNYQI